MTTVYTVRFIEFLDLLSTILVMSCISLSQKSGGPVIIYDLGLMGLNSSWSQTHWSLVQEFACLGVHLSVVLGFTCPGVHLFGGSLVRGFTSPGVHLSILFAGLESPLLGFATPRGQADAVLLKYIRMMLFCWNI